MTATAPSLEEELVELLERVARLQAAAVTLRSAADSLRDDRSRETLITVVGDLQHELQLAEREAARVRARTTG